ncbi:MAG: hypothetical protein CBD97_02065 [Pelagibacteraceae bacterium TMED237]|nr:MAG: hypothetical protein CBD97_02065 [Pelagibacteraceae bacterium TMED237]|tara:strand:- start:9 stop:2039 length:2031 start_codon:yes stop_codon:yes gene_type:complete
MLIKFLLIVIVIIVSIAVFTSIILIARECYHKKIQKNNSIISEQAITEEKEKGEYFKNLDQKDYMLSFSGGGFRSVVNCTGCLRAVISRIKRKNEKFTLNKFLEKYKILSGNSGGSWFLALLTYSRNYFNLIDGNEKYTFKTYIETVNKCNIKYIQKMYNNRTFMNSLINILNYDKNVIDYAKHSLNYYNSSWQNIINDLILEPTGDINKLTSISSNPNNLNYSVVISSIILKQSVLNQISDDNKKSRLNTSYFINDPNCCENEKKCCGCDIISGEKGLFGNCGFGIPIYFNWDHNSKKSNLPLYSGNSNYKNKKQSMEYISGYNFFSKPIKKVINYDLGKSGVSVMYTEHDTNVLLHSKFNKKNIQVNLDSKIDSSFPIYTIISASSAAGAFITSDKMLDYLFQKNGNVKVEVTKDLIYILDKHANLDISGGANIAHTLNYSSVPIKLPTYNGTNKNLDSIIDGLIDINTPLNTVSNEGIVKLGDGGYFDNSSIVGGVLDWQSKNNNDNKLKIICINDANLFIPLEWDKNNINIGILFGYSGYLSKNKGKYINSRTYDYAFHKDMYLSCGNPQIFPNEDFEKNEMLYTKKFYDKKETLDITINYYNTKTIKNKILNVKEGTLIDLYVLEFNSTCEVFLSNDIKLNEKYIYNEKLIYEIILNKIPENIFNRIFDND